MEHPRKVSEVRKPRAEGDLGQATLWIAQLLSRRRNPHAV